MENNLITYFHIDRKHVNCAIEALNTNKDEPIGKLLEIRYVALSLAQLKIEYKDALSAMYFGIWFERNRIKFDSDAIKSTK